MHLAPADFVAHRAARRLYAPIWFVSGYRHPVEERFTRFDGRWRVTQNTSPKYGRLLVIEPDPLLRWSLATYFSRWYDVCEAQDEAVAQGVIQQGGIDALIVADALGDAANRLVTSAKEGNAVVAVIRTVTRLPDPTHAENGIHFVEKPFQLSQLAELLGITSVNMRRNA